MLVEVYRPVDVAKEGCFPCSGGPCFRYVKLSFVESIQKSIQRPFFSQSPYRVGSGPLGPPNSLGRFSFFSAEFSTFSFSATSDSI